MQKLFYITCNASQNGIDAPTMDRFQRVEHLNELLNLGWNIKEMNSDEKGTFFVLEKTAVNEKG